MIAPEREITWWHYVNAYYAVNMVVLMWHAQGRI